MRLISFLFFYVIFGILFSSSGFSVAEAAFTGNPTVLEIESGSDCDQPQVAIPGGTFNCEGSFLLSLASLCPSASRRSNNISRVVNIRQKIKRYEVMTGLSPPRFSY